jgi:hypothetical protein
VEGGDGGRPAGGWADWPLGLGSRRAGGGGRRRGRGDRASDAAGETKEGRSLEEEGAGWKQLGLEGFGGLFFDYRLVAGQCRASHRAAHFWVVPRADTMGRGGGPSTKTLSGRAALSTIDCA